MSETQASLVERLEGDGQEIISELRAAWELCDATEGTVFTDEFGEHYRVPREKWDALASLFDKHGHPAHAATTLLSALDTKDAENAALKAEIERLKGENRALRDEYLEERSARMAANNREFSAAERAQAAEAQVASLTEQRDAAINTADSAWAEQAIAALELYDDELQGLLEALKGVETDEGKTRTVVASIGHWRCIKAALLALLKSHGVDQNPPRMRGFACNFGR